MIIKSVILGAAMMLLLFLGRAHADCTQMQRLAQEHSNDMAARRSMDHAGFADRARRGARAENVAWGCKTEACAQALWSRSPPHAANMMLPYRCKAVRHSGVYWTMEIGP